MGNFQKHPDAACKYVCEELDSVWRPGSDEGPRAGPASEKPVTKVATRPGRCHAFDKTGHCPVGQACPYRGAHQGQPSRRVKRPREYDSDSDHGTPSRRDDRPRRSDKDREYDRDRDRDRSKERDRPRERAREPRRISFADGK